MFRQSRVLLLAREQIGAGRHTPVLPAIASEQKSRLKFRVIGFASVEINGCDAGHCLRDQREIAKTGLAAKTRETGVPGKFIGKSMGVGLIVVIEQRKITDIVAPPIEADIATQSMVDFGKGLAKDRRWVARVGENIGQTQMVPKTGGAVGHLPAGVGKRNAGCVIPAEKRGKKRQSLAVATPFELALRTDRPQFLANPAIDGRRRQCPRRIPADIGVLQRNRREKRAGFDRPASRRQGNRAIAQRGLDQIDGGSLSGRGPKIDKGQYVAGYLRGAV